MMRARLVNALLGLVIVAIAGTLLWLLLRALVRWFDHQSGNVRTAVIGAVAVVIVPVVTYVANRANDRRRSVNEALRLKKVELYEEAIRFLTKVFASNAAGGGSDLETTFGFLKEFTPRVIAYGSNDVIQTWVGVWGTRGGVSEPDNFHNLRALERILKAFRKDLGHSTYSLREFDLARLLVNDIDDALAERENEEKAAKALKGTPGRRRKGNADQADG